jgi:K+-transporting ATPase KdpF subunit
MTLWVWIGLALALVAFAYLVYALLKTEDFS